MKYSRSLVATLLMSGGLLQLAPLALAAGTNAGQGIDNTANATYEDPTAPGTIIDATSNKVTVTVAEVSGITVTSGSITSATAATTVTLTPGEKVYYNYTLTNVGNNPTQFHIPGVVTIAGPGTPTLNALASNPSPVQYSIDGGANWLDVPTGGLDTSATSKIPVNGTVLVRVGVTVNSNTGSSLDVRLGNSPSDDISQPKATSGAFDDVYTEGGTPVNGQSESSAILKGAIGSTVQNSALATILLTRTGASDNNTPALLTDDVISYKLDLRVENSSPQTGFTAVPLAGTKNISVDGALAKRILISNAVPVGTELTGTVSAPTGWTAVYTVSSTGTVANAAIWTTVKPASGVTRIGFVSAVGTEVADNSTVSGFAFNVKTNSTTVITANSYTIDSIAQVFGSTSGSDASIVVYDESGDQTPNNYSAANPLSATSLKATSTGAATQGEYGVDTLNTNSGTDVDGTILSTGEINQYSNTYTAPVAKSLLNGPNGSPGAKGPDTVTPANGNTDNFDFSNKSSAVPVGALPGTTFDPDKVTFNNTVLNNGTTQSNIALLPELVAASILPVDTEVKILTGAGQSATYKLTANGFVFQSATGTSNGVAISATNPVTLANVAPNDPTSYQVEVNLPTGTRLSTDPGFEKGYGVVINAFIGGTVTTDANGVATIATSFTPATGPVVQTPFVSNKTIDRVYTGFIQLVKETRILQNGATKPPVRPQDVGFSQADKVPGLGNIIEYRITYKNVSEAQVGTGNAVLNAKNLTIIEDGTNAVNSWAKDGSNTSPGNGIIDTSNVENSAQNDNLNPGITTLFKGTAGNQTTTLEQSGTDAATDVTKYVNKITNEVEPTKTGSFSFKRVLN
jgi:hypothetical protein